MNDRRKRFANHVYTILVAFLGVFANAAVHGELAVDNPSVPGVVGSVNGAQMIRRIDSDGSMTDLFAGGSAPGQPSYPYRQQFYDLTTYATVTGLTGYAVGGQVHYFAYALGNTCGTPASSSDTCIVGESWDDRTTTTTAWPPIPSSVWLSRPSDP